MTIDKSQIIELLTSQGKGDQAQEADAQLPDKVDPEAHADLLKKFGIDPADLIGKLSGGLGGGGLGKVGGFGGLGG